jgi:hypothetical protein
MPRRGTEISGSAAAAALPLLKAAEAGDALEVRPGSPWRGGETITRAPWVKGAEGEGCLKTSVGLSSSPAEAGRWPDTSRHRVDELTVTLASSPPPLRSLDTHGGSR